MKISLINRLLLFTTTLFASYQVAIGIEGLSIIPIIVYTIGFGTLLVACLMLVILGYNALENSYVAIISTVIPMSLSYGLIWEYSSNLRIPYLIFTLLGLLLITISRLLFAGRLSNLILAIVHGIAGLLIFILPIIAILMGLAHSLFIFVSIGGGFVGIGGSMLYMLKADNSFFPNSTILRSFPVLLFLATISFVVGFTAHF